MSTNIKIPKFCVFCGKTFIAQTTTTKYCSKQCNSRHYKAIKRDQKVRATLKEQIGNAKTESNDIINFPTQSAQTNHFISLKDKEFLGVQEAATLLGPSRWTIQRMIQRAELKVAKIGKRTIIARTDINNLFN